MVSYTTTDKGKHALTFQHCGSSILGSCGHILTKSVSDLCLHVHVSMCPKPPICAPDTPLAEWPILHQTLGTQRTLGYPLPLGSAQGTGRTGSVLGPRGRCGGCCFPVDGAWQACSSLRSQDLIPGITGSGLAVLGTPPSRQCTPCPWCSPAALRDREHGFLGRLLEADSG